MKDMDFYFNNFQTIPEFATLSVLDKNSSIAIEGLIFICGIESHSNLFQKLTNILMKKN